MLTLAPSAFEGREGCVRTSFHDGPATLERFIVLGNPTLLVEELRGCAAASAALVELAAADDLEGEDDDGPITQEFVVRGPHLEPFDASCIDALVALEGMEADDTASCAPSIQASVVSYDDLRKMNRLLEPPSHLTSLAAR